MKKIRLLAVLSIFLLSACGKLDTISQKVKEKFLSDYSSYENLRVLSIDTHENGKYYNSNVYWFCNGYYTNTYISYYEKNELVVERVLVK